MRPATDRPAAELDSQLNTAGGGRTQHPAADMPHAAAAPVSALPSRAAGKPSPVRVPRPEAGEGTKTSRPAGSPSHLPGGASTSPRDRVRTVAGTEAGSGGVGGTRDAAEIPLPAGQAAIAAAMSEDRGPDSLDAHVRKLCRDLGLLRFHVHDSRRSPAGFPDLVIVGPYGVLFRELKRQSGKASPEQQAWLGALQVAGQDACVWRPSHLLNGSIARELASIAGLRMAPERPGAA